MLFSWLRRRRRNKLINAPFPQEWPGYLQEHVPPYATLSDDERTRLHGLVRVLVDEKQWEGCGGLTMTDEVRVTVACWAGLLVLNLTDNYFDRVETVLVYPSTYVVPSQPMDETGFMIGDSTRLCEAHYRGPVVLSWAAILEDIRFPAAGRNVVLHEFAHQLDMLNNLVDGTPNLESQVQFDRWQQVMDREFQQLVRAVTHGRQTVLDPYGAENEGEFFAVVCECFFLRPQAMKREHLGMYLVLRDYFHQDPLARGAPWEQEW